MYDLYGLGAWFRYMQLRCKRKIYKETYRMFARDFLMLRNKCHFVISVIAINVFYCISFWVLNGLILHLIKLKIPFTHGYFVRLPWLKSAQEFWRRRFLNKLLFCSYLPLEKDEVSYLNKLESPSPKDTFCQICLKSAQWFWS